MFPHFSAGGAGRWPAALRSHRWDRCRARLGLGRGALGGLGRTLQVGEKWCIKFITHTYISYMHIYIYIRTHIHMQIYAYIYLPILSPPFYQISRAPGIWWFLGNIGYQGQDAIFGAVYAHKGRTKKFKRHGLHGFALDQPSINGIGPINCSEKTSCFVAYVHEKCLKIV